MATLSEKGVDAKVYATQMSQGIVTTQYGRLRGILVTEPEKDMPQVEAYLGLEYASLLGGELRFMPPTSPVGKWNGVKPALKFKPVCPQRLPDLTKTAKISPRFVYEHYKRLMPFLEAQQEDCLNLNVYRPATGEMSVIISTDSMVINYIIFFIIVVVMVSIVNHYDLSAVFILLIKEAVIN